jgi:hypothetical protein
MQNKSGTHITQGQSIVELSLTLPILILLLIGMVEVVNICRNYLALLGGSYEGAHLGSQGLTRYDNNEIYTLVTQGLAQEGYTDSSLIDVIITRATLVGGTGIQNYQVYNMKGSGRTSIFTPSILAGRLRSGDPSGKIIVVEIVYDHKLLFNVYFQTHFH